MITSTLWSAQRTCGKLLESCDIQWYLEGTTYIIRTPNPNHYTQSHPLKEDSVSSLKICYQGLLCHFWWSVKCWTGYRRELAPKKVYLWSFDFVSYSTSFLTRSFIMFAAERVPKDADDRTDFSRWRLKADDNGRHVWHYLRTDEECAAWPQTTYDKYWLGLDTVSAFWGGWAYSLIWALLLV